MTLFQLPTSCKAKPRVHAECFVTRGQACTLIFWSWQFIPTSKQKPLNGHLEWHLREDIAHFQPFSIFLGSTGSAKRRTFACGVARHTRSNVAVSNKQFTRRKSNLSTYYIIILGSTTPVQAKPSDCVCWLFFGRRSGSGQPTLDCVGSHRWGEIKSARQMSFRSHEPRPKTYCKRALRLHPVGGRFLPNGACHTS